MYSSQSVKYSENNLCVIDYKSSKSSFPMIKNKSEELFLLSNIMADKSSFVTQIVCLFLLSQNDDTDEENSFDQWVQCFGTSMKNTKSKCFYTPSTKRLHKSRLWHLLNITLGQHYLFLKNVRIF